MNPAWDGWPAPAAILEIVGAGRAQTHEMLRRLRAQIPSVVGCPGRPPASPVDERKRWQVVTAVRDFAITHPGCTYLAGGRRWYSSEFRSFVLDLCAAGGPAAAMSKAELSETTGVPVGTLKEWLAVPAVTQPQCDADADDDEPSPGMIILSTNLQLVVRLWRQWQGTFKAFCAMLRTEHRLPYSDSHVNDFLSAMREKERKRRRPVEAPWSSDTFRTFFPGAQWLGDGTEIGIRWGGEFFVFNLEAIVDGASNATVGFDVTDTENEEALRLAYLSGLETTGAAPAGITLDNAPSNHSPDAKAGMPGAVVLRATPGRGQAKAPIEGSFGLFQQALPPLAVTGPMAREMARDTLRLIFTAWFRGRNGKPRRRLRGDTPANFYSNARPSPEDYQKVLKYFQELERRQERMRLTREARLDPVRIGLLSQGLQHLGIPDPDRRLTLSLASYARDAIVYGLSVFHSKHDLGTLPPDAGGRYLGGIIRNHHVKLELLSFADHVLEQRTRLGDLSLKPLRNAESRLRATLPLHHLPQAFVDQALAAEYTIDFGYWSKAAAATLSAISEEIRKPLFHALSRRTAGAFKADRERREDLLVQLATAVPP